MGVEFLLIIAGVIMQAASDAHTKVWNVGETLWHIGVIILAVELVVWFVVVALGGASLIRSRNRW